MSAAITYSGVPGARGLLFKETSFYVFQRVPDRKTILDLITQNGGKIVKTDTNKADIIIADHPRPEYPSTSLHWKFIKDSIDNGAIQETDKYLIHQSPIASRPVGSSRSPALSAPLKGTRTPFTAADDAILAKWVLSHPINKRSGNEVYKALEEMNNRHTRQSWRDRWVKKVSKLSQAALDSLVASAPNIQHSTPFSEIAQAGRGRSLAPVAPAVVQLPAAETRAKRATQEAEAKPELTPSERNKFIKAEDDELLQAAREHGPPLTTRFFQAFADRNTSHSLVAWRKHWTDILKPLLDENFEEKDPLPQELSTSNHMLKPGQLSRRDEQARQLDTLPITKTSGPVVPPVSRPTAEKDDSTQTPATQGDGVASHGISREFFFDHLKGFWEFRRLKGAADSEINKLDLGINPEINGQPIDTYLLWQVVRDQYQQGGVEIEWEAAAKSLGLQSEAAQPLQQYYTDYVFEFAASGVLDEPDAESEDDEETSQSEKDELDLGMLAKPQDMRSDATLSTSKKRLAIAMDPFGTPSTPNGRKKRQRFASDDEIPSTPDERLVIASFGNIGPSPSLSAGQGHRAVHDEVDLDMEGQVEQSPSRRARRFEPETQDFAFEDAPGQETQGNTEFDISPSQQLLGEVDAVESVTPVPLSFKDKGKGVEREPATISSTARGLPAEDIKVAPKERKERAIPDSQESLDKTAELEDLIERFDTFGYAREDIITALKATSLCTPLATDLLRHLMKHKELPNNWQGVWTTNDDRRLRRVDDGDLEAGPNRAKLQKYWDYLVKKHTQERIQRRREFLAYLDEVAQSSQ
ncbi:Rap1 Myb domain-containing protein [Colletotrichum graminicola]|uniref:DNA-binding protein RAP1 n=1 Tax=Colletotrichum graminicola (strain M1.001 / M2 / FGSC 10212) TaxID=645133 RepID=E3QRM6_COLGM|nr:Rap1 Myb domain-containing protein [Colletotrichum graminicola M1.001]EFQ33514.1 Rap1 Myb domain-containing protein [Colletotrichum graminicola M1.001]WDK22295.1 Rap1 Myb domain-containing protein [Colletotrichum graminicola]